MTMLWPHLIITPGEETVDWEILMSHSKYPFTVEEYDHMLACREASGVIGLDLGKYSLLLFYCIKHAIYLILTRILVSQRKNTRRISFA